MLTMERPILLLDLPPPLHGMSQVNDVISRSCESAYTISTTWIFKVSRGRIPIGAAKAFGFPFVLLYFTARLVVDCRSRATIYRPINGGKGQIYDVILLGLARFFRRRVVIHHHSFAYIREFNALFRFLLLVAGKNTSHIVLAPEMEFGLRKVYKITQPITVLSNSFFVASDIQSSGVGAILDHAPRRVKPKQIVLGHMANLSFEKGLKFFVSLHEKLQSLDSVEVVSLIAGPYSSADVEEYLKCKMASVEGLNYLGPLYGAAKYEFYRRVDIFVFPSQYVNEAQPLVLFEAASANCLLIGSTTGCLASTLETLGGLSIPVINEDQWASEVVREISDISKPYFDGSIRTDELFWSDVEKSKNVFEKIFDCIPLKLHIDIVDAEHNLDRSL